MKKRVWMKWAAAACCAALTLVLASCEEEFIGPAPYNPAEPIVCTSFFPTGGPISTKVVLTGKNFGNRPKDVKVWFNEKEAPVIGVSGDHALVMAPRLPGENVVIKMKIGEQEACFDGYFDYEIHTNISTICGGDAGAQDNPTGTVSLASAQFSNNINQCISVDAGKNIYFEIDAGDSKFYRYVANEEADQLKLIDEIGIFLTVPINVYDDVHKRIYHMQANIGNNEFYYYDPNNDWAPSTKSEISWNTAVDEFSPGGMASWAARRTAAMCPVDNKFYSRTYGGYVVRYDPEEAKGENLTVLSGGVGVGTTSGSTYGLVFDGSDPNIFYFTVDELGRIYKYDIRTYSCTLFAGASGTGFMDGPLSTAKFSNPHQMCRDSEGNLFIADTGNHCIRKINMKTGYVSTVAGIPQKAGYLNGTDAVALFNEPVGLCIDEDDIMYVGDSKNHALRRVAIE